MAEVVQQSLQHLSDADIGAIALYLKSLPAAALEKPEPAPAYPARAARAQAQFDSGAKLYDQHCADCHQADGSGIPPAYPPLAGNRALTMAEAANPIRIVLNGGFAPGTAGTPRPYGMPAYGPLMNDEEVAAVVSYLRGAWGNKAPPVSANEVNKYRSVPLD